MSARSTDDAMQPDHVLQDRYELTRLLGRGGMSEVYLGRDRELGRTVAIKLMPAQLHEDPQQGERLRREARAVAAIDHPNVVAVHDLGISGSNSPAPGSVFVVMEYVDGESVRDHVERDGAMAADAAVTIAGQVCLALQAAHEARIVHRDISPGNIVLCHDGTVKVLDFGIARMADSAFRTATGSVLGTPAYVSPEQVQGSPLDARSDLYSLGCCLYYMLTARVPFSGGEAIAVAHQHVSATPVSPRRFNPDIPPELERVILRALSKSPERRYASATAMRSDLVAGRGGETVPVDLSDPSENTRRTSTRAGTLSLSAETEEQGGSRPPRETTTDPDIDQRDSASVRRWLGIALIVVASVLLLAALGFAAFEVFLGR